MVSDTSNTSLASDTDVWAFAESLKQILKKYSKISDIVLFGKPMRGSENFNKENLELIIVLKREDEDLKQVLELNLGEQVSLSVLTSDDISSSKQWFLAVIEGFSLKHDDFLRNIYGVSPKKMYSYKINHLSSSEKRSFNRNLLKLIKKTSANKLGAGTILIPIQHSAYFEDFLAVWSIDSSSEIFTVI